MTHNGFAIETREGFIQAACSCGWSGDMCSDEEVAMFTWVEHMDTLTCEACNTVGTHQAYCHAYRCPHSRVGSMGICEICGVEVGNWRELKQA